MNNTSKLVKAIISALFLLLSVSFYVISGSYSLITYIFLFALFAVMAYSSGVYTLVIYPIISYLLILLSIYLTNPGTEMFYEAFRVLLFVCPASGFMGYSLKKKYDFYVTYTGSVLIFVLSLMIHLAKVVLLDKINIIDTYIRIPFNLMLNSGFPMSAIPSAQGVLTTDPEIISHLVDALASSIPSIIIIFSMVAMIIMLFISKKAVKAVNRNESFEGMVPFSHLKIRRSTSLVLFILYLISIFASGTFGIIVGNIISVLVVMCIGCGFSLIEFYFKKAIRISVLRLFIYVTGFSFISLVLSMISFVNPVMLLALLGMIDAARDFRKIDKFNIRILFK